MKKLFFMIGAAFGLLGVAAGAFGAHVLRPSLPPEMMAVFEVGVTYQMYHGFALMFTSLAMEKHQPQFVLAGYSFIAGILLFSGSLYLLSLSGVRWVGAITPIGGTLFLAGWGLLMWGAWKHMQRR